jgi:hypothetical protein
MSKLPTKTNLHESQHHSHLFTVRVRREDLGDGRSEWRGKVQHALSGEACYFHDWQTLVTFMVEKATIAPNDLPFDG